MDYAQAVRSVLCPARRAVVDREVEVKRLRVEEAERALAQHRDEHGC